MRILTHIYKNFNCAYFLIFCAVLQTININSATIIVSSEDDSGAGTLRDAINTAVDSDTIVFASNVTKINLLTPLPFITQNDLTIDGLAQVSGSEVIPGDCASLPSPLDDPEFFSEALQITIDGSAILQSTANRGIGLDIRGSDVTIRGLRIQNFNGQVVLGSQGSNAIGITSINNASSNIPPTIECCEIKNITSKTASNPTEVTIGDASGIEVAQSVNKCFIHDISSTSDFASNVRIIGSASGINDSLTVTNCLIENITQGSCSSSFFEFTKFAAGIAVTTATSDPTDITIQNCTIKNVCGGTIEIFDTAGPSIFIGQVSGIFLFPRFSNILTSTIDNVSICNVNAGTIVVNTLDKIIDISSVQGIFSNDQINTIIRNSCITCVNGYDIEALGDNNSIFYLEVAGITVASETTLIINNSINNIHGNNITLDGNGNNAFIQFTGLTSSCIPYIPFSTIGIKINSLSNENSIIANNAIKNVGNTTHAINGSQALLLASGSAGIAIQDSLRQFNNTTSITTNNTVTSVTGPTYAITSNDAQTFQLNGTSGIYAQTFKARVSENSIKNIHEGAMTTKNNNSVNLYALPLTRALDLGLPSEDIAFLPVYTNGITVSGNRGDSSTIAMDAITITNNHVEHVKASYGNGPNNTLFSYAVGIHAQPSLNQLGEIFRQPTECQNFIGVITNNIINNIKSNATASSYGIFVDGSNSLIESSIELQSNPLVESRLLVQENSIHAINGAGSIAPLNVPLTDSTLIPLLPLEPTSGIFSLFGGCSRLKENNISDVHAPTTRGITTVASSDMEITANAVFNTNGPGMFVGGASADPILITNTDIFDQQEFEDYFPSVRNTIYSNATYANDGEGIKLGVINWNNFFTSVPLLPCEPLLAARNKIKGGPIEVEIVGNHDQPAPHIMRVVCNNNGTITIEIKFSDPNHPNSTFIIQFFRNSSNGIPHGEQLISNFDNPQFMLTTDENGTLRTSFTFVPAAHVKNTDIISAHITLIADESLGEDIGDTSEFRIEATTRKDPACHLQKHSSDRMLFCHRK